MYRYAAVADDEGDVKVTFFFYGVNVNVNTAKIFENETIDVSYVAYEHIVNIFSTT